MSSQLTQAEIETMTDELRELKSMIKTQKDSYQNQSRPKLSVKSDEMDLHQKALDGYIRRGDEADLRTLGFEGKAMSTAVNSDGGFLVDPQTSEQIATTLEGGSSLRAVANIVQVEAGSYDVLIDHGGFAAGWVGENDARPETDTAEFARISIALHELSAMPKSSQRLLDDAAFDVETWLGERIAESFSLSEAQAFISGDGLSKPQGILAHPLVDNDDWQWGEIGYVNTGVAGDFDATQPADALIDLVFALPALYRKRAAFVMNSKTAGAVRKMKDSEGRFLWDDGLAAGEPSRLLGYNVLICEDMPDVDAENCAIAFGDFYAGYTIAERPDLRILRDPFSAKPHVLFYASKRIGGDVTNFEAIKLLRFAANG